MSTTAEFKNQLNKQPICLKLFHKENAQMNERKGYLTDEF